MRLGRRQPNCFRIVGRLPAVVVVAGVWLCASGAACNQERKAPPAPKSRSEAIESTAASPAQPAAPARASAAPVAKPRPAMCGGRLKPGGSEPPGGELERASAPGEAMPPAALPVGGGKWTWVNFWAAWCVPCKEEIPRLRSWEKRLNQAGISFRLQFVSLDDDERQLREFLRTQPRGGLKASYWLREGKEREQWLKEAGMEADPELPVHLLIDTRGRVRCVVNGAIEDRDYDQLVGLLRG